MSLTCLWKHGRKTTLNPDAASVDKPGCGFRAKGSIYCFPHCLRDDEGRRVGLAQCWLELSQGY